MDWTYSQMSYVFNSPNSIFKSKVKKVQGIPEESD